MSNSSYTTRVYVERLIRSMENEHVKVGSADVMAICITLVKAMTLLSDAGVLIKIADPKEQLVIDIRWFIALYGKGESQDD